MIVSQEDLRLDKKVALSRVSPAPNTVSQMPGHKYSAHIHTYKMLQTDTDKCIFSIFPSHGSALKTQHF